MQDKPYQVLFICTQNSARSIMAEALMNRLGAPRFVAHSAGSHPAGAVQPLALEALLRRSLPIDGLHSKGWERFAAPGAPALDFVFTVCDKAAGELCPVWPGQPVTASWGVPDPAAVQGTPEQMQRAYEDAAIVLRRRIDLFLALPLASLDRMSLQREVDAIGRR